MPVVIILLAAAACFLLAALGVATGIHLIPLGLLLWVVGEAVDTWYARRG